jgi:hypothetical protein
VAPGAAINVNNGNPATATINPLVDALKKAVTDNKCAAISVSYGFCGTTNSFFTGTLDPILAQAAAQGQSVFISSGDDGAAGIVLNSAQTACVTGKSRNVSELSAPNSRLPMTVPITMSGARPNRSGMIPRALAAVAPVQSSRSLRGRLRSLQPTQSATFPISPWDRVQSRRAFIGATIIAAAPR